MESLDTDSKKTDKAEFQWKGKTTAHGWEEELVRLVLSLQGSLSANISTVIMIIINDHDDVLRMQSMLIVVAVEMI